MSENTIHFKSDIISSHRPESTYNSLSLSRMGEDHTFWHALHCCKSEGHKHWIEECAVFLFVCNTQGKTTVFTDLWSYNDPEFVVRWISTNQKWVWTILLKQIQSSPLYFSDPVSGQGLWLLKLLNNHKFTLLNILQIKSLFFFKNYKMKCT